MIISCCVSDPTYESPDPVSKVVNWSQHPLQDPIHKGRSVFKQSPSSIGIQVYVQWAILSISEFLFPEISLCDETSDRKLEYFQGIARARARSN